MEVVNPWYRMVQNRGMPNSLPQSMILVQPTIEKYTAISSVMFARLSSVWPTAKCGLNHGTEHPPRSFTSHEHYTREFMWEWPDGSYILVSVTKTPEVMPTSNWERLIKFL
jgi:hypothetical protein